MIFASSEAVPFAKTGGLGDVAGSLPRALKHAGARVAVILPKYASIPQEYKDQMKHVADFYVPLAWRNEYCGIEKLTLQDLDFYFVDNEAYFKRDGLYGYFDDGERFAFFSKAICEAIAKVPELECDVLHCNDWQTAMCCVFLREFYQQVPQCANVKTVLHGPQREVPGPVQRQGPRGGAGPRPHPRRAATSSTATRDSINYMKGALCYAGLPHHGKPELCLRAADALLRRGSRRHLPSSLQRAPRHPQRHRPDHLGPRDRPHDPGQLLGQGPGEQGGVQARPPGGAGPGAGPHAPARRLHRPSHGPEGPGTGALRDGPSHAARRSGGHSRHGRQGPRGCLPLLRRQVRRSDVRAHRL